MSKYVGADWASRKGWLCVVLEDDEWTAEMQPSMLSVWHHHSDAETILVDIPIGLPESKRRECDVEAKEYLGSERSSSVFYTPCRAAVEAGSFDEASAINSDKVDSGLSSQAWGIIPRIREVEEFLTEVETVDTIREAHPEVTFAALNGGEALTSSKTKDYGIKARLDVLASHLDGAAATFHKLVEAHIESVPAWQRRIGTGNREDLVDAFALAVTARSGDGDLSTLPENPPTDGEERPMEICYYEEEDDGSFRICRITRPFNNAR
jgi:predicted RNase H-like nuclease